MWKFSAALRQKTHLHYTTDEEREAIRKRFREEGLDEFMADDKKLPHVWRWLSDAESNWLSLRKQNEKLHKQQEAEFKEVEEYIEYLWKVNNERLLQLETENRTLKFELENVKIGKKLEQNNLVMVDIFKNNKTNINNNKKANGIQAENNYEEVSSNNLTNNLDQDTGKENKKSALNNFKQVFIKNNSSKAKFELNGKKHDQVTNATKQGNLQKEIRFLHEKCRKIEVEKKLLETENENLIFKLNETLSICELLEKSKTDSQLARISKSLYELRDSTSEYRLDSLNTKQDQLPNKISVSKTIANLKAANSSKRVDQIDDLEINNLSQTSSNKQLNDCLENGVQNESCKKFENALWLMDAARTECAQLRSELAMKEKLFIDLQAKYDIRKARYKDRMLRLKEYIERETKRWENLFQAANQKRLEAENELLTLKQN